MLTKCILPFPLRISRNFKVWQRGRNYTKLSSVFPVYLDTMSPSKAGADKESENKSESAVLMKRANMLYTSAPGVYSLSPVLSRVLAKLHKIVNEEMASVGAQQVVLPVLGTSDMWKKSGRWGEIGSELIKLTDRNEKAYCLSPTHEEVITSMIASHSPISYKHLPIKLYQIGRKFRDEGRPKNGLLRCREFEMKDLYTFDSSLENARTSYVKVSEAYHAIFKRLEIPYVCVEAECGNIGGILSHEYHVFAEAGEDHLCCCSVCKKWYNQELVDSHDNAKLCELEKCDHKEFSRRSGIEVAHTFLLGTKYSRVFKANFQNSEGKLENLVMGCFGLGMTRLLAAIVESLCRTENKHFWPQQLSPYSIVIIPQKEGYKADITFKMAETLATDLSKLTNLKNEVVLDDRLTLSIGRRVAQAKTNSFPVIVVVGKTALKENPVYEVMDTYRNTCEYLQHEDLVSLLKKTRKPVLLDIL